MVESSRPWQNVKGKQTNLRGMLVSTAQPTVKGTWVHWESPGFVKGQPSTCHLQGLADPEEDWSRSACKRRSFHLPVFLIRLNSCQSWNLCISEKDLDFKTCSFSLVSYIFLASHGETFYQRGSCVHLWIHFFIGNECLLKSNKILHIIGKS